MAMSVLMQKVYDKVAEFDKDLKITDKILSTDEIFINTVIVKHEDGTFFQFENASAFRVLKAGLIYTEDLYNLKIHEHENESQNKKTEIPKELGWLVVFTEHNGFHLFACSDLEWYVQFKKIKVEIQELFKEEQQ